MNIIFHIANGMVLPPAMFFAWNFYKFKGNEIKFRRLWVSMAILSLTVIATSLQFVFPEIITALNRSRQGILSGELWRLVTPLFIQPMGIWQCFFNGLFFISFVPIAEHLYGRSVMLIYFGIGAIGQLIIIYWETTPGGLPTAGGGSSTALYALMGALIMYTMINRKIFPNGYILIPIAGFLGATILIFFEDGHAPVLLLGGIYGLLSRRKSRQITAYQ
jgi:membrane associated rhomboid family serine protease